jgi:rubrerythrin
MIDEKFMTWLDYFRINKFVEGAHQRLFADMKELFLLMYKNKIITKEQILEFYNEEDIVDVKFDDSVEALENVQDRIKQMQKSLEKEIQQNDEFKKQIEEEYKRRGIKPDDKI